MYWRTGLLALGKWRLFCNPFPSHFWTGFAKMLVGFLCHFTSVLCSMVFCFWAAFGCGMATSLLFSLSAAMTWLSHLHCFPNMGHKWVNPLGFHRHIIHPFCPSWYHADLSFPNIFWWKVTLLRAKGGKKEKKRDRRKRNILDFPGSFLICWGWMGQVRQSSVQIKTYIWHWSITRAWEEVKHVMMLFLSPCKHFSSALIQPVLAECIYIFDLHSLLVKKSA